MPFGMSATDLRRYLATTPAEVAAPFLRQRARETPLLSTGGRVGVTALALAGGVTAARGAALMTSLTPGTTPAPVLPGAGEWGATTPDFCNLIPNMAARAACMAAAAALGMGGSSGGPPAFNPSGACPPGYKPRADGGCQLEGMAPYIPGDIGRQDVIWTPVAGRYGAGLSPMAVESTRLWCPAGYKLGKDNVCYECISKTARKWNPGTKPMLTGGDMNAIRRAKRLQKRVKKISGKLFPAPRCGPPKRKRK